MSDARKAAVLFCPSIFYSSFADVLDQSSFLMFPLSRVNVINPLVTNGFTHTLPNGRVNFHFRGSGSDVSFLFHFSMKFMSANRIVSDGRPGFAASHLGLFCLHMPHKKDGLTCIQGSFSALWT